MSVFLPERAAFACFAMPPGDTSDYLAELMALVKVHLTDAKIVPAFLFGKGDILLSIVGSDFRNIPPLQADFLSKPRLLESGLSANWIFAVPYEGTIILPELATFVFLTQVRLERRPFLGAEVKQALRDKILDLASQASIPAIAYAGIGWPDLILHGTFEPEQHTDFVELLLKIRHLRIESPSNGSPEFVIGKTFTQIGLTLDKHGVPKLPSGIRLMTSIRTGTGGFQGTFRKIEQAIKGNRLSKSTQLYATNGIFDLYLQAKVNAIRPGRSTRLLADITHGSPNALAIGIEKTETHMLFDQVELAASRTDLALESGHLNIPSTARRHLVVPKRDKIPWIDFQSTQSTLKNTAVQTEVRLIPKSLELTIAHVLSILQCTANDAISHFDSRPAIAACVNGLHNILNQMTAVWSELKKEPSENPLNDSEVSTAIKALVSELNDWCDICLKVISERAAGTFEEAEGLRDRLSAFRGSVQKFLYLADMVMHEFLQRIDTEVLGEVEKNVYRFAAVYEHGDQIRSRPWAGLVKIPIKHRFSLSRSITSLWHEVGLSVFRLKYRSPLNDRLEDLFQNLNGVVKELAYRRFKDKITKKEEWVKIKGNEEVDFRLINSRQAFDEIAEIYADLIVFRYGFGGDEEKFLLDISFGLIQLLSDSPTFRNEIVTEVSHVIRRIGVVREFSRRMQNPSSADFDESFHPRLGSKVFGRDLNHEVGRIASKLFISRIGPRGYASVYKTMPQTLKRCSELATSFLRSHTFNILYYPFILDLLKAWKGKPTPCTKLDPTQVARLENGEIVDLSAPDVIPAVFDLYDKELQNHLSMLPREHFPRYRAALATSSVLAFEAQQLEDLDF